MAFLLLLAGSALCMPHAAASPIPLAPLEQYLAPYTDSALEYRDMPMLDNYLSFLDLFDVRSPDAMGDFFRVLFGPASVYVIPVNIDYVILVDVPGNPLPVDAKIHITQLEFRNFTGVKQFKPLRMIPNTRYMWTSGVVFEEVTVVARGTITLAVVRDAPLVVTMRLIDPSIDYDAVGGLNKTRVCEVWTTDRGTHQECFMWAVIYDEVNETDFFGQPTTRIVNGLNFTNVTLSAKDLEVDAVVTDTGSDATDKAVSDQLTKQLKLHKKDIMKEMEKDGARMQGDMNTKSNTNVKTAHESENCTMEDEEVVDTSTVCVQSTPVAAVQLLDCAAPSGPSSHQFVISDASLSVEALVEADINECRDVEEVFPDARPGQILRVTLDAEPGLRLVANQRFRYMPGAGVAMLSCSADADCHLQSSANSQVWFWPLCVGAPLATLAITMFVLRRRRRGGDNDAEDLGVSLQGA